MNLSIYRLHISYPTKQSNLSDFRPPEDLWSFFDDFSSQHVAAMAPCLYHYDTPRNKVPHYGQTGLNAGIMHMDLARMRDIPDGWTRATMAMHDKFKKQIKLADQVTVLPSYSWLSWCYLLISVLTGHP